MYSTRRGTSLDRHNLTVLDRPLALQKLTRYLSEKVRATGSDKAMSTFNSGFSTLLWLRRVTAPLPISPEHENFTPSFVASMATGYGQRYLSQWLEVTSVPDSESAIKSRQILWNSAAGMDIVAEYSVSGIPRCS